MVWWLSLVQVVTLPVVRTGVLCCPSPSRGVELALLLRPVPSSCLWFLGSYAGGFAHIRPAVQSLSSRTGGGRVLPSPGHTGRLLLSSCPPAATRLDLRVPRPVASVPYLGRWVSHPSAAAAPFPAAALQETVLGPASGLVCGSHRVLLARPHLASS